MRSGRWVIVLVAAVACQCLAAAQTPRGKQAAGEAACPSVPGVYAWRGGSWLELHPAGAAVHLGRIWVMQTSGGGQRTHVTLEVSARPVGLGKKGLIVCVTAPNIGPPPELVGLDKTAGGWEFEPSVDDEATLPTSAIAMEPGKSARVFVASPKRGSYLLVVEPPQPGALLALLRQLQSTSFAISLR